jgi:hypothetical protein
MKKLPRHRSEIMDRIESATAGQGDIQRPLWDEELTAVNGGVIIALGGPDTRPQTSDGTTQHFFTVRFFDGRL